MSSPERTTRTADRPQAVARLDPARRAAHGARGAPRAAGSAHAEWAAGPDRADPVTLLRRRRRHESPGLVPLRHERMLGSPFTFYRGAAVIMAADLASVPSSGLAGAGLRRRTPRQLQQLRGAGSLIGLRHERLRRDRTRPVRVGRQAARRKAPRVSPPDHASSGPESPRGVVRRVASTYREAMAQFATMTNLDVCRTSDRL